MNKETYIHMRQQNQLTHELLFDYYLEQCKEMNITPLVKDLNMFIQTFQYYFMMFSPNVDPILKEYDSKFGINLLKDKEGNIIKIY
jgi:hypothetical protein